MSKIIGNTVGTPMSPKKITEEAKAEAELAKTTADEAKAAAEEIKSSTIIEIPPNEHGVFPITEVGTYHIYVEFESSDNVVGDMYNIFSLYASNVDRSSVSGFVAAEEEDINSNYYSGEITIKNPPSDYDPNAVGYVVRGGDKSAPIKSVAITTTNSFTKSTDRRFEEFQTYVDKTDLRVEQFEIMAGRAEDLAYHAKTTAEEAKYIEIEPSKIRKGGTYKTEVSYGSNSVNRYFLIEALDRYGNVSHTIFDGGSETNHTVEITDDDCKYGVAIDTDAEWYKIFAPLDIVIEDCDKKVEKATIVESVEVLFEHSGEERFIKGGTYHLRIDYAEGTTDRYTELIKPESFEIVFSTEGKQIDGYYYETDIELEEGYYFADAFFKKVTLSGTVETSATKFANDTNGRLKTIEQALGSYITDIDALLGG